MRHCGARAGAAVAIARLDRVAREVRYAGVGNISGVILDTRTGATTSMVSQNGTVGYAIRKIQVFQYPWTEESLLLMHSDGLATHWSLDRYPGLGQRHPSLVAGVLYRDHKRGRDDVTVLAAGYQTGDRHEHAASEPGDPRRSSTSCWPGSGRGRSPRFWALPRWTRPESRPRRRRSLAIPCSMREAGELIFSSSPERRRLW